MRLYTRPAPLAADHELDLFVCGTDPLDSWLHRKARRNETAGDSRTFVSCPTTDRRRVVGFYSLAASSVALAAAPGAVRRNMPDPIPVVLLGRLAVAQDHQGVGLGAGLLPDAVRRVVGVADTVGIRALLVHAIDDAAASFYRRFGFVPSAADEATLFLSMQSMRASLMET